jgi:hypothetical protein
MLKKPSGFVLASFRGSTYGKEYASPLHSLRPCWTAFLSILRISSFVSRRSSVVTDVTMEELPPHGTQPAQDTATSPTRWRPQACRALFGAAWTSRACTDVASLIRDAVHLGGVHRRGNTLPAHRLAGAHQRGAIYSSRRAPHYSSRRGPSRRTRYGRGTSEKGCYERADHESVRSLRAIIHLWRLWLLVRAGGHHRTADGLDRREISELSLSRLS